MLSITYEQCYRYIDEQYLRDVAKLIEIQNINSF